MAGLFSGISSDTYREINDRWMGKPLIQVVDWRPLVAVATVAIFLIGLLVAFSLALRSQVRRKTAELVETNRELLASQRRNRAFIAALPDLFYITDAQGRYLEFITSNRALLYKEEDQCLGKRITEVMASTGISDLLMGALRAVVQGSPLEIVEYGLPINGEPKRFECRVVKIEDDRILFIVRDSTQPWIVMRELEKSLEEKEILLREIHHRVKNNLQVVSSLIHLESSSFDSEKDRLLLEETQQRIASMAQVHELLYRSENLSSIDGGTYIQRLYDELSSAYIDVSSAVTTRIDADSVELNLDTAIPLGLIINEIVTNAFKYAFLGRREGTLDIIFKQQADGFRSLTIADDGPGLGEGWEDRLTDSLGITLIRSLSEQLRGKLTIENGSPRGVRIRLVF
jgi:two-component sensor histidine kinase